MSKIYTILIRKKKKEIIDIYEEALNLMQTYNGRTKFYCIATALGYDVIEKQDGSELAIFNPMNQKKQRSKTKN